MPRERSGSRSIARSDPDGRIGPGGYPHVLTRTRTPARAATLALAAVLLLTSGLTGCRGSAPDDLIGQVQTTQALVFVKSKATTTLNKTWADANLYKLSP